MPWVRDRHLGRRPGLMGGPDRLVMPTGRVSNEVGEKIARAVEQQRQEHAGKEHVWEQADIQAKIGDPSQPASVEWPAEEWSAAFARAKEQRVTHAGYLVRGVVNHLDRWLDPSEFRPDEAAEALARMEDGDDLIADLRVRSAWLTRVLDEAEAARRREG
jgi:hypothetical protein